MRIILGSSSPCRARIMRRLYPGFVTMTADIDEKTIRHPNASYLVMAIALAKSKALRDRVGPGDLLITADTVLVCNGVIREKPADVAEAARFIRAYRLHPASVVTGVVAYDGGTRRDVSAVDSTLVEFKLLTDAAVDRLCADPTAIAGAGAFVADHALWQQHIRRIQGSRSGAAGLPERIVEAHIRTLSVS